MFCKPTFKFLAPATMVAALTLMGCEQKREIIDVETPNGELEVNETDDGKTTIEFNEK